MPNSVFLSFEGSALLYTLNVLHNTPNVVELNKSSCPYLSTY